MLIAFVFVLLVIGLGILASLYSVFIPFFHSLGNITAYNSAYYGAIGASERGLLAVKYQKPGFIGSGGRNGDGNFGPSSDGKKNSLGRLEIGDNLWSVSSRSNLVPQTGGGDIEYLLLGSGSENFNKLSYNTLERFILSVDGTTNPEGFYSGDSLLNNYSGESLVLYLRLPQKILSKFNTSNSDLALLCDSSDSLVSCDFDGDKLDNDVVISRNLKGILSSKNVDFSIIPRTNVLYNHNPVVINDGGDTNVREKDINEVGENPILNFSQNSQNFNPVTVRTPYLVKKHNVISAEAGLIETGNYREIFEKSEELELEIALVNFLQSRLGLIYPFLEYRLVSDAPISDKFFTIDGNSKINEYDVHIVIKKPTYNTNVAGTFTIIF